ncbi:MAG: hypothetical protein Tsb0014_02140 [Pleurocapsa sp.]
MQNRQPLALKLLCPDVNQSCWYRTGELPLALWMGVFIAAGAITSLVWQLFSAWAYSSSTKEKYTAPPSAYRDEVDTAANKRTTFNKPRFEEKTSLRNSDWESKSTDDNWNQIVSTTKNKESSTTEPTTISSDYEVRREPENIERSGSTYSYKFREASDRNQREQFEPDKNSSSDQDSNQSNKNQSNYTEEDDEDWI